jgi:hypothetical protein
MKDYFRDSPALQLSAPTSGDVLRDTTGVMTIRSPSPSQWPDSVDSGMPENLRESGHVAKPT